MPTTCAVQVTGPIALEDPYIAADQLAGLGPGSPTAASARLTAAVTLVNAGAASRCVLVASIAEAPHTGLRGGAGVRVRVLCSRVRHRPPGLYSVWNQRTSMSGTMLAGGPGARRAAVRRGILRL